MTYIVALHLHEAQERAAARELEADQWKFVASAGTLKDATRADDVLFAGKWYMRSDRREIERAVSRLSNR